MSTNILRAGAAKRDVTPSAPLPYLGRDPRHMLFKGVDSRMYLRALTLQDNNTAICIISFDGIGFNGNIFGKGDFDEVFKDTVFKRTGVKNVMLASSHIHSTPETLNFRPFINAKGANEWLLSVIEKACEAIGEAQTAAVPAKVYFADKAVPGYTQNRRGAPHIDNTLSVMQFKSLAGDNIAAIVHFACHPVVMQVTENICTDFVGVIQETLENKTGGVTLFLQGACADIDPLRFRAGEKEDFLFMGNALANEVLSITESLPKPLKNVKLSVANETVFLPSRELPPDDKRKEIIRLYKENKANEETYFRTVEGASPYKAFLQAIKIGDKIFAGVPGEVFCETGLKLKRINNNALTVGYANGYFGYIAPPSEWERGGYEIDFGMWSKVSAEAHDIVYKRLVSLIGLK